MLNLLPALLPVAVKAIRGVLEKKAPEVAAKLDEVMADPQTRVELEKLALEKARLELEPEKMELTDRASARELAMREAMSDSWLSKNVRPLTLCALSGSFLLLTFLSAFTQIKTPPQLIDTFQGLLMWVYAFYFGGRSFEKIAALFRRK